MFSGEYPNIIQGDNRVPIPTQFLKKLGGVGTKVIVTESPDQCLCLFPSGNLEEIEKALGKKSRFEMVVIKSAGRIPISNGLRAHAGLEKEVAFAGCGSYIEIWNQARWGDRKKRAAEDRAAVLNE